MAKRVLTPMVGHLRGHTQHEKAHRQALLRSHQHLQFLHLTYPRRQNLFQAQRLTATREERRASMQARQRGCPRLMALSQPLEIKVAQVLHVECPWLYRLGIERAAVIGDPSIRQLRSPELS